MSYDDNRVVEFDDDFPLLPDQTSDEAPRAWGEAEASNDERLREERPPHWD